MAYTTGAMLFLTCIARCNVAAAYAGLYIHMPRMPASLEGRRAAACICLHNEVVINIVGTGQ